MASDKKSRTKSAMTGKKSKSKKSGKKPHKIHISRTANGRYNVEHEFAPESGQPNEIHAVNDVDELKDHVAENMGEEEPQQVAQPQQAQPQVNA